jgi:hypothetical protein
MSPNGSVPVRSMLEIESAFAEVLAAALLASITLNKLERL